jgi:lysostaphin
VAIPQESASPGPKTYIVKPGDTLTSIAIKFNTTVAALVAANQLSNPNNITVGQTLIIP